MGTITVRARGVGQNAPGEAHVIDSPPFTILVSSPDIDAVEVLDDDVMVIDPEMTVRLARQFNPDLWREIIKERRFLHLWGKMFPESEPPSSLENAGLGTLHVAGMILWIAHAALKEKRPYLKFPETYLHPKQQANLTDLFLVFQRYSKS